MGHLIVAFLILLVGFVVVATVLAILFPRRPWLGVSQHWGLQLWQLALLAAAAGIAFASWWIAVLSAVIALYWSVRLFSRRPVAESGGTALLRVVSANLLHGNEDYARALRMIEASDADVVVLSEVTAAAREAFQPLASVFPHALDTCAPDSPYGIAILSRVRLTLRSRGIGEDPLPRHLAADLTIDGQIVTLVAIHPTNPLRLDRAHRIPVEFDAVAALCKSAPEALILIGDCNAAGWSHSARLLENTAKLRNDGRIRPSWPTWLPMPLRLPLDHVWVRGGLRLAHTRLGGRFGSDHLPLIADIAWRDE